MLSLHTQQCIVQRGCLGQQRAAGRWTIPSRCTADHLKGSHLRQNPPRPSVRAAAAEVSQSTAAGAAAGSEGFQEAIFPELKNSTEERDWVANAVQVWLDEEWTPLDAHKGLGKEAGEAYLAARESGKDEAGDVLLVLTDRLSKANYKDTFVDEFGVSNKVIELLMLHHNMDVSCYRKSDRDQYKQIEKEVTS
ncbi:hypothetical protein WJX74_004833 [Apatococcus lobatus]|uniref:Uncharacterized protein n=1 Tax=Apatococcus lobatus TaxID=904363 RepID=A0AAW1Q652_9CHLO